VKASGKNIIIHVETLADYPTRVDRLIIFKEGLPDDKVFEASSDNGQIWRIVLHAGRNDLSAVIRAGTYKVLFPHANGFMLMPNEPYRIRVCHAGWCNSAPFSSR